MDPTKVMFNHFLNNGNTSEIIFMLQQGFKHLGKEELEILEKNGYTLQIVPKSTITALPSPNSMSANVFTPKTMQLPVIDMVDMKSFTFNELSQCEASAAVFAEILSRKLPGHAVLLNYLQINGTVLNQVLSHAARTNNLELVKTLYYLVFARPIHCFEEYAEVAVMNNALDVCDFLSQNGCKFKAEWFSDINKISNELLKWALINTKLINVNVMLDQAVVAGDLQKVETIMIVGAPVDFTVEQSPLLLAASAGQYEIARFLMDRGVVVGGALVNAIQVQDVCMVELLLKRKGDLSKEELVNIMALYPNAEIMALMKNHFERMKMRMV